MSAPPVIANPPAFPGTQPKVELLQPVTAPRDIYADFLNMWTTHVRTTVSTKKTLGEAYSGKGSVEAFFTENDAYRTNRFDLSTHFVRAFEHLQQPVPIRSADQVTNPVGRAFVSLLDQHISDTDGLTVKALAAKKVFDGLNPQQQQNIERVQQEFLSVVPGNSTDSIVARDFLRLHLIARNASDPVSTGRNVGTDPGQLMQVAKAFDGVTDVITNGVKIVNILANVYVSIAQKLGPQRYQGDIIAPVTSNYAAFGNLLAAEPFFQQHQAENVATLAKAGLKASGNVAQDVWNAHLVQVAILVDAETTVDAALKAGNTTPAMTAALDDARGAVVEHAPSLAGLWSMAFGIPPFKALEFPAPERL
jgi:hypothetical protein